MLNKGNTSGLFNEGTNMNLDYIQGNKKGG